VKWKINRLDPRRLDFKFPCPASNDPSWHNYHRDHPYHPADQKTVYTEAFKVEPKPVAPGYGARQ
jgi:hypothetical protein